VGRAHPIRNKARIPRLPAALLLDQLQGSGRSVASPAPYEPRKPRRGGTVRARQHGAAATSPGWLEFLKPRIVPQPHNAPTREPLRNPLAAPALPVPPLDFANLVIWRIGNRQANAIPFDSTKKPELPVRPAFIGAGQNPMDLGAGNAFVHLVVTRPHVPNVRP